LQKLVELLVEKFSLDLRTDFIDLPIQANRQSSLSLPDTLCLFIQFLNTFRHMESGPVAEAPPRLLDTMRDTIRRKNYSLRTEETYLHWVRRFIYFHNKRHPHGSGIAGPFERGDHDDLYARDEQGRPGCLQSAG
jgi:hypothetical protein